MIGLMVNPARFPLQGVSDSVAGVDGLTGRHMNDIIVKN